MFDHLLVPTDGSELSKAAMAQAVQLARRAGARITVLHVQPSYYGSPDVAIYGEGLVLDPELSERFRAANAAVAESVLAEALEQARAAGVEATGETCVRPLVHEAILETARRHGCDLIFMASHGRRGLAGLLLGSETQRVLTHADIPVLVFPGRSVAPA